MLFLKTIDTQFGKIVINKNDEFIGRSFLDGNYWGLDDILQIANFLNDKDKITFYDVGANIGSHSIALSSIFGDKIKIKAFEAQWNIYKMFKQSIELNKINNIKLYPNAVSNKDNETISVELPNYSETNNFGGLELQQPYQNSDNNELTKSGVFEEIKTITLDSFDEKVDFIKIDVEGMELNVLQGSKKLITNHRPIFFVEVLKSNFKDLEKFFKFYDYNIYARGIDAYMIPKEL